MAKDNPIAKHNAIEWRYLPCDVTRNAFLDAVRGSGKPLSVSTLSKTLSYLEQDRQADDPSIYRDLCQPRDSRAEAKTTYPRLIPWEVYALLEAIVQARPHHEKIYGDELAQRVLEQLSKSLDSPTSDTETEDYRLWHILNNDGVQQAALSSFTSALKSRLSYIENEVCAPTHKINAEKLLLALEQLDVLIYLLRQKPSNVPKKYDSVTSAVLGLYTDLLSVRNSLNIDAVVKKRDQTAFNWHRTDRTNSLVDAMICQLNKTSRNPTPEQVSSFLSLYQEYLAEETDVELKESALSALKKLQELKQYIGASEDITELKKQIHDDLSALARTIFLELNNLDTIEYAYSEFEPSTASSAYMQSLLTKYHQYILRAIHTPLRLLRAVYTLHYFTQGKTDISDEILKKIKEVKQYLIMEQKNLCKRYPNRLNVNLNSTSSTQKFARRYCEAVDSIIDNPLSCQTIVDRLSTVDIENEDGANNIYRGLIGAAQVLKLQCEMVVAIEIKEAIPKLVQTYLDMPKYPPV